MVKARAVLESCRLMRGKECCMEPAWAKGYTEEDYYKLPEKVRAELIDGQFYYMAAPSRIHQKILIEMSGNIRD